MSQTWIERITELAQHKGRLLAEIEWLEARLTKAQAAVLETVDAIAKVAKLQDNWKGEVKRGRLNLLPPMSDVEWDILPRPRSRNEQPTPGERVLADEADYSKLQTRNSKIAPPPGRRKPARKLTPAERKARAADQEKIEGQRLEAAERTAVVAPVAGVGGDRSGMASGWGEASVRERLNK